MLSSILLMLLLFSVLIIAHEFGHFWVARRCGVRVERFGFGLPFGPTLWSRKIGDTEFCVHAALFGGYVAFPDDNPDSAIPKDSPERFENRPLHQRAAIALAGVTVNAILGWALMFAVLMAWGLPGVEMKIRETLSPTTPAALAGIRPGDAIEGINGRTLSELPFEQRLDYFMDTLRQSPNKPVVITLSQGKAVRDVTVTPNGEGKIGIAIGGGEEIYTPVSSPWMAATETNRMLYRIVVGNFQALGKLFTGQVKTQELSGPLRIVKEGADLIDHGGIQKGLMLTAVISVILAVMNLLPIPALDGGHLLFIAIEALKGKPLNKEMQERVTQVGFLGLLALMVFILWNDVNNVLVHPVSSLPK